MHGHKIAVYSVDDDLRAAGGYARHGNGVAGGGGSCFSRVGSRYIEIFVGSASWCDIHSEGAGAARRRRLIAQGLYIDEMESVL